MAIAKRPPRATKSVDKKKTPTAQQAITREYGLVKNDAGQWVKPNKAFLERQLEAQGWGKGQTGVTPVEIGGMRFLTGQGQLTYTGDRSDAAKRNPGTAYNAASLRGTKANKNLGGHLADDLGRTGPQTVYAEGDLTRTGTAAAQGKAYQLSQQLYGTDAGTVLGATSVPSVAQAAGEAAAGAAGGARKKASKKKGKRQGRRTGKK